MEIGDEQIYRLRDFDPSQRVRVCDVETKKTHTRYDIEFLDGERRGERETVPRRRLRGPWSGVVEYDRVMAGWERISTDTLTEHEDSATSVVFDSLISRDVAVMETGLAGGATTIRDPVALEALIGLPTHELVEQVESFPVDEGVVVSATGTLMIAEFACRIDPMPVLNWVVEDEREYRERTKRGHSFTSHDGHRMTTDPDWEYRWYLERGRPVHELLRGWCGHRAVTLQERLAAAEAEVQRLDVLLARVIDQVKDNGHSIVADVLASTHEDERITPANYRPVVDRPLKPSEIPVRYERAPRRWGYR